MAIDIGVPVPSIAAAIDARVLSSLIGERAAAAKVIEGPELRPYDGDVQELIQSVHDALYAAKICAYAQGMDLIGEASKMQEWSIDLGELARIWKGGCIIRARFLDLIMQSYEGNPNLPNLLLDASMRREIETRQKAWRTTVGLAQIAGIPIAGMASGLAYFDSYRTANLPQNLTQAQRDAFGSHTYQRRDDPSGPFVHTDWLEGNS